MGDFGDACDGGVVWVGKFPCLNQLKKHAAQPRPGYHGFKALSTVSFTGPLPTVPVLWLTDATVELPSAPSFPVCPAAIVWWTPPL